MADRYDERFDEGYNENEQRDRERLGAQPMDQIAQEPGDEFSPMRSGAIPRGETGEARWAGAEMGRLGSMGGRDWTEPRDTMADAEANSLGASPAPTNDETSSSTLPTNASFEDRGIGGPPTEAYGQGVTREFSPLGTDQGIEQQDVLQSQQYEREEREQQRGFLGTVGDALGKLFGNDKREPLDDEQRR